MTGKFGLLGERLSHSFSPYIHSLLGNYEYKLYEKSPDELESFLLHGDFDGLNVTIPYKKAVFPYCSSLSGKARETGSINTMLRNPDGSLHGDNTDCCGFAYMLEKLEIQVWGKKALVLGSGGASLSVQAVLREYGAGKAVVVSRGGENNYQNISKHGNAQIIVNTTPLGMYPNCGEAPVDLRSFTECEAVLDLIYNPLKTALLLDAEELLLPCMSGLSMLAAQAKKASELFQGKAIPDEIIDLITDSLARRARNIVLIGMPGCGKTTVGRALAGITGREFYDTDEMVALNAKRPVPDIIKTEGEEAFRRLETEALREVSAKTGCVIATGGGIVTIPGNLRLIRQNSTAVFLDRDICELATEGRPLSLSGGATRLAAARLPLYRQWCDFAVSVQGINETAERIKEILRL